MKKYIVIIVILTISQGFLIEARTIDDVLEDFQPIFNEIHEKTSNEQLYAHERGNKIISNMRAFISQHSWDNINAIQTSEKDIRNQMTLILTETGMIHHEDLIRHCYTKEQADSAYYKKEGYATNEICQTIGSKNVKNVDYALAKLYQIQANFHTEVESTRIKCKNSTTPLDMQSCLIQQLYFYYKPMSKNYEELMLDILNNIDANILRLNENLKDCFITVHERIVNKKLPIITDFKRCVVEAAKNKPVYNKNGYFNKLIK